MIPKKIHYCWFGGEFKPDDKCIESWKKFCPEYEIIRWDESNFDINCNVFVKSAYEAKKWAFVSDYARLWIIYNYGGFYLDTDVELIKSLDTLRANKLYFGLEGDAVNSGLGFGAEAGAEFLKENMRVYEELNPFDENGKFTSAPCPFYTTQLLKGKGFVPPNKKQIVIVDGIMIYPDEFFNPYNWATGKTRITKNTISIHHYFASWMTEDARRFNINRHNYELIERKYGKTAAKAYDYIFWSKKKNGGPGLIKRVGERFASKKEIK